MYKIILILVFIFITGCEDKLKEEKKIYDNYIEEIKSNTKYNDSLPFDINIYCEKITDDEVTYRVIIDNPKEDIKDIEAIVIHNMNTSDVFPTSGIFDEEYNLIPNLIDKDNNCIKGIILVGYIPFSKDIDKFNAEFKALVKYTDSSNKIKKVYYSSITDN